MPKSLLWGFKPSRMHALTWACFPKCPAAGGQDSSSLNSSAVTLEIILEPLLSYKVF